MADPCRIQLQFLGLHTRAKTKGGHLAALFLWCQSPYTRYKVTGTLLMEAAFLALTELMEAPIFEGDRLTYGLTKTLRSQDCIENQVL